MSKAGKLVKDMVKAKKESVMGKLGDSPYNDPMEPWSVKYNEPIKYNQPIKEEELNEDGLLMKYIRSLGFNPEFMSFAQRSSYARSNAFKRYKEGHTFDREKQNLNKEETEQLDEAGTGLLMSFIKSKGLNPLAMDGNQKKAYARSSEFKIFKMRHVKETSGMGERGDDWNEEKKPKAKKVQEEADAKDTVCMDIPLLIRVLEFVREDVKTDVELHKVVERLIDMRHDVPLTMEHYDSITGKLKESVSYEPNTGRQTKTGAGHTIVGHSFHANGTKHANIMKHGETGKYFAAGGSSSHPVKSTTFHDSPEEAAKSKKSYVKEEKDRGEYDYEGSMAKTLLQTICRNAEDIKNMLEDDENLPEWVQSKITKAEDYITTSLDYLKSTKELDEEVEQVDELSSDMLGRYKKAASDQSSAADKAGDYAKGNKRFSGIMKATRKQFDNDAKKVNELKNMPDNMDGDDHITREEKKMKGADPCWKGYQMVGSKKKGGRTVPNCVPEEVVQEGIGGIEDSPMSATNSVKAMESQQRKKNMKSARIIKSIYKKKAKNETTYDWEKDDKPNAKVTLQGGTTMTGKPRDTVEIEPVLKTRPNSQKQ